MEKEISLGIVLEMLEMQKKKVIDNSTSYSDAQEQLKEIEDERKKIISGDKEAISKIVDKYDKEFLKK